jgi:hypothetical protein
MFKKLQKEFEGMNGGEVNLVDTIRCPKILRLLNARLPKAKNDEDNNKKTVGFATRKNIS